MKIILLSAGAVAALALTLLGTQAAAQVFPTTEFLQIDAPSNLLTDPTVNAFWTATADGVGGTFTISTEVTVTNLLTNVTTSGVTLSVSDTGSQAATSAPNGAYGTFNYQALNGPGTFSLTEGSTNFLTGTFSLFTIADDTPGQSLGVTADNASLPAQVVFTSSNVFDLQGAFNAFINTGPFVGSSQTGHYDAPVITGSNIDSFQTIVVGGGFSEYTPSSPAPEPTTWALMLAGVAGVGGVLRRRRIALAA